MGKQLIAVLLSVCLFAGPAAPRLARAAGEARVPAERKGAPVDPAAASALFDKNNIFKGEKDPLRTYFFAKDGKLTIIGEVLYRYLSKDEERVRDFRQHFEQLRQLGPATEKQLKAAEDAQGELQQRFKSVFELFEEGDSADQSAFLQNALLSVSFDGASRNAESPEYTQVNVADGYAFMDKDGLAVKMAKSMVCRHKDWPEGTEPLTMSMSRFEKFKQDQQISGEWKNWLCGEGAGVTVFSRQLQDQQKKMNLNRPSCAREIPVTGRYNFEMLVYSHCLLKVDVDNAERAMRIDIMVRVAQLTGEQFVDDQFLEDHKNGDRLWNYLKEKGRKKKLDVYDAICGRKVADVWDLVNCKLEKRKKYVDEASKHLQTYQTRIAAFEGRQAITQAEISGLQADESLVRKYLTLGFLEAQRNQAMSQLEGVNFEILCKKGNAWVQVKPDDPCVKTDAAKVNVIAGDSPDSERLRKAIEEGDFSDEVKKNYLAKGQVIADRILRLLRVYTDVESQLLRASHTAPMGKIQAALSATQKELMETGLDLRIYTSIPMMAQLGGKEGEGWKRWTSYKVSQGINGLGGLFGAKWREKYLSNRDTLKKYLPVFMRVSELVAKGDFEGARMALLEISPEALREVGVSVGEAGDDPNRSQKIEAVLQKTNQVVTDLMKEHIYWDIGLDIVKWSVAMAVFAPAASAVLTGVSRAMVTTANVLAKIPKVGRALALVPRIIGGIAEHSAIRLQSLSPHASRLQQKTMLGRMAMAATVRGVNTGVRIATFSLGLAGGMSGGINWAMYEKDKLLGNNRSPYRDGGTAFMQGYTQGAKWAAENAWIMFVGNPSSAYEETFLAGPTKSLAERGALGNAAALGNWAKRGVGSLFGKQYGSANIVDKALGAAMSAEGRWAPLLKGVATVGSMADHIGKYMLVSHGAGYIAKEWSFRRNTFDRDNVERRIKRAEASGMKQMQEKWWLLVPTFSAKYGAQVEQSQRSQHGFAEYKKRGELHKIANSAEGAELPLRTAPKQNALTRMFEFQLLRERPADMKFRVMKEMKYGAIREELINHVRGKGAKPGKVDLGGLNPNKFMDIYGTKRQKIGRLELSEEVRDQALSVAEDIFLANQGLTSKVLSSKVGTNLKGYGVVTTASQEDLAAILMRANTAGKKVSGANLKAARAILKPHIESAEFVDSAAMQFRNALYGNKAPSAAFQTSLDKILLRTTRWKNDAAYQAKTPYQKLVKVFRRYTEAQAKKGIISGSEATVFKRMFDYIDAIDKRFQTPALAQTATGRALEALGQVREAYGQTGKTNVKVVGLLDKMNDQIRNWGEANKGADAVAGNTYHQMLDGLRKEVQALRDQKIPEADVGYLDRALKQADSASRLLHDSQGTALTGWRPAQFEGLMHWFNLISKDGAAAAKNIRNFLKMGTGTGKTLICYEGMLPLAEADARALKLKGGTIFLTVQSNLESQARIEFKSLKKVTSRLEIDTWEGFKSRIAQGKLEFKGGADDYWILGDEMDGAALQPALTIGEQTAMIGKRGSGYDFLKKIGDRMRRMLGSRPATVSKGLTQQAGYRDKIVTEALPEGKVRTEYLAGSKKLSGMTRSLQRLQSETFQPSIDRTQALQRARGMLKNLEGSKTLQSRNPGAVQELQSTMQKLQRAQGSGLQAAIDKLDSSMRKVWKVNNTLAVTRQVTRIQSLIESQNSLVTGLKGDAAKDFRAAGTEMKNILAKRDVMAGADRQLIVSDFRRMFMEQQAVLNQTPKAGLQQAARLRKMAKAARRGGRGAEAVKMEAQAQQLLKASNDARKGLEANAQQIMKVLEGGQNGWEGQVRQLVTKRSRMVDRAVVKQNPIYEIFRDMRNDMYSFVRSRTRVTSVRDVVDGAPTKAARALERAGDALTRDAISLVRKYEGLVKTGKGGPQAAAKLKQAQGLFREAWKQRRTWRTQAKDLRSLLSSTPKDANHAGLLRARTEAMKRLQAAETDFMAAQGQLTAAQTKLNGAEGSKGTALAKLQQGVEGAQAKVKSAEARVAERTTEATKIFRDLQAYEGYEVSLVKKTLQGIQKDASAFRQTFGAKMTGLDASHTAALQRNLATFEGSWTPQIKRMDWSPKRAVETFHRKLSGVSTPELVGRQILKWTGMRSVMSNVPGLKNTRWAKPLTPTDVGLTRAYAFKLMKAFLKDPFIAPEVRWKMFWTLMPSTVSPQGFGGQGSWVYKEMLNLARGYTDNPGNIRIDNISGKINVIHNGQWFDSMDTPTRRYWEIEYGSDLTLPYEHKTMVTMNDFIKDNPRVRFTGFSGTAGREFRDYMTKYNVRIGGYAPDPQGAKLKLTHSPTGKYTAVGDAVRAIRTSDAAKIKAGGQADGLVVLSIPDTRMLKSVRKYLLKTGQIQANEISMVFSDSEWLRLNRPQAHVLRQMNLDALRDGKIKVLMLDTRVGGRGLDLNFKGKGSAVFNGYRNFKMLILDPHLASEAHYIQAQGRIDLGRVPKGAVREFTMVMDVSGAGKDPVFSKMLSTEPLFLQLRQHPQVLDIALKNGRAVPNHSDIFTFIQRVEALEAASGKQGAVTPRYYEKWRQELGKKQLIVEQDQLRSASVLQDAGIFDPLQYGLSPIPRGMR